MGTTWDPGIPWNSVGFHGSVRRAVGKVQKSAPPSEGSAERGSFSGGAGAGTLSVPFLRGNVAFSEGAQCVLPLERHGVRRSQGRWPPGIHGIPWNSMEFLGPMYFPLGIYLLI